MIETENTDGVDVFLSAPTAPSPVVTASCNKDYIITLCPVWVLTNQFWGKCCTLGSSFLASSAPPRVANNTAKPEDEARSVETGGD